MNVLIVGHAAREHAMGWKMRQDPECHKLFFAPGNGGTMEIGENVPIEATQVGALVQYAREKKIDLTVVGGEAPLPLGIVDRFRQNRRAIFGPTAKAARLESSKIIAKHVFWREAIPTATHRAFDSQPAALKYVEQVDTLPIVIKANGLASGRGVRVCYTKETAQQAIEDFMERNTLGHAGTTILIEEFLHGREASVHALCDGERHVLIPTAWQDHKTLGPATREHSEGTGPMTGGMGTYGPVPWMTPDVMARIDSTIIAKILTGIRNLGAPFTGCLYPGLMMTDDGPKVLETNVRPGAPETESWMRQMENPLEMFDSCARGRLDAARLQMNKRYAVSIVLASSGYPGKYPKGHRIVGIDEARGNPNVQVFHGGTDVVDGTLVTSGGRVLTVSATADDLPTAIKAANTAVSRIQFLDAHGKDTKVVRPDIGQQGLQYLAEQGA